MLSPFFSGDKNMATAAYVTFLGAPENIDVLTWGELQLPLNEPVFVDPDAATTGWQRVLYEHLLTDCTTHAQFRIEEELPVKSRRVKGRDDEDDGEENGNGDYDLSTLPKGWRELHHKRLIAMAHKAGAGDEVNTRDGAIAFIEERLSLDASKDEVPF
jgi:hypothetical protein